MLRCIVLGTVVSGGKEVFTAERLSAMLTLEWEEVDEETGAATGVESFFSMKILKSDHS